MGSCFSKKEKEEASQTPKEKPSRRSSARDPPLPETDEPQEEETVKEVLSETPRARAREDVAVLKEAEKEITAAQKKGAINGCDDRSEEASEVCSVSEGFSVSTTVTEKKEEEVEEDVLGMMMMMRKRPNFQRKRSNSGDFHTKKERGGVEVGCRSRRSSPSPVRRADGAIARTHSAREAARTRVPAWNGLRREPGERSSRRSVSPAVKRAADHRTAAAAGQCRSLSSSRVNGRSSPRRIVAEATGGGGRSGQDDATTAAGGEVGASEGKESLENPLVSLECFIFL